jgi:S1-C subfamily serine protease
MNRGRTARESLLIEENHNVTYGGFGGPLFNNQGKAIGMNFATVRSFGRANLAIPIRYGEPLLRL